jgi:Ankyrin repeats (3 copies)
VHPRLLNRWSSATRAAALLKGSDDVLEALLRAAPADRLAELTHRTLAMMCRSHKLHNVCDNDDDSEYSNCTALQRRASLLVSKGGRITAINEVNAYERDIPLLTITARGCAGCVKYFIEQLGADVTAVSADNSTALHAAAAGSNSDVAELLL